MKTLIGKVHTKIIKADNGDIKVRYHNTDVVTFNKNEITLDTGGWKTVTTKKRMNQVSEQYDLGYHVYQKHGEWYVEYNNDVSEFWATAMVINRHKKIGG